MKIAINDSGNDFSARWISYCTDKGIDHKRVDCTSNDIVAQLSDCDALMWHFHQGDSREILFAKQLIYSLQAGGMKVFPDFNTAWHFDDKVAQKYLLESTGAPFTPTWVFYNRDEALEWSSRTSFPKVFKLRGGAGSENVRLIRSRDEAVKFIRKAFGRGFRNYDSVEWFLDSLKKFRAGRTSFTDLRQRAVKIFRIPEYTKVAGRERGYIYFQEYIEGNDHDIRVVIIRDKAFAVKRMVRENDFRASGSGKILYDRDLFDESLISLSFVLSRKLKTQSIAFDYVHRDGKPLLVEISYGYSPAAYDKCPGYWDEDLKWHEGSFNPCGWMVENLINF